MGKNWTIFVTLAQQESRRPNRRTRIDSGIGEASLTFPNIENINIHNLLSPSLHPHYQNSLSAFGNASSEFEYTTNYALGGDGQKKHERANTNIPKNANADSPG